MSTSCERFGQIKAALVRRENGGWLAVSEEGAPLRIGVTASSADEARSRFAWAIHEWSILLDEQTEDGERTVK